MTQCTAARALLVALSLAAVAATLPACGSGPEGVGRSFDGMAAILDDVNEDPSRSAALVIVEDCARDAREGKISMMEAVMFKNELKTAAKDGSIGDDDLSHLRAQHELMIKE